MTSKLTTDSRCRINFVGKTVRVIGWQSELSSSGFVKHTWLASLQSTEAEGKFFPFHISARCDEDISDMVNS